MPDSSYRRTRARHEEMQHERVCPGCGRPVLTCSECGSLIYTMRPETKTCSDGCRVHRHRRLKREAAKEGGAA